MSTNENLLSSFIVNCIFAYQIQGDILVVQPALEESVKIEDWSSKESSEEY